MLACGRLEQDEPDGDRREQDDLRHGDHAGVGARLHRPEEQRREDGVRVDEARVREQDDRGGEEQACFLARERDLVHRAARRTEQAAERDEAEQRADEERERRADERAVHARAEEDEDRAREQPRERLRDEVRPEPVEAAKALEQPEREREQAGQAERHAEERRGERRDTDRVRERHREDRDEHRRRRGKQHDAAQPAAHEDVERGLVLAGAVLGGELRGGRLDDLRADRLDDEHTEELRQERELIRTEQARHDELVPEGERVRDAGRDVEEELRARPEQPLAHYSGCRRSPAAHRSASTSSPKKMSGVIALHSSPCRAIAVP